MANQRVPPQNLDAEESVLGAMLISSSAIEKCIEVLTADEFYRESHGKIFDACVALYGDSQPADVITVVDKLEERGQLADVGGKERIFELGALVPTTSNAGHYARIVHETAIFRSLTIIGDQISQVGWDREGDATTAVEDAERMIFDLSQSRRRGDFVTSFEAAGDALKRLAELAAQGKDIVGLPTGLQVLDRMMSGLHPGNLIVVAGRPSMGKTALALRIAANVSIGEPAIPVAVFTLEMSRAEIMQRMFSTEACVDSDHVMTPRRMNTEDWDRVNAAASRLASAPIHIEDTGSITMLEIRSKARKLKLRYPDLGLIIVDYIQLMGGSTGRYESRNLEISQISRGLKLLAGELQVPVIALSQLSRDVEKRHDSRPTLSDLRDSGAIEQDSDVVLLLYREEYYFPEDEEHQGLAEVIVAKHRNGPTGSRKLSFVSRFARFSDLPNPGHPI